MDNIFTRIYGKYAVYCLKTGDYATVINKILSCECRERPTLVFPILACHLRYCKNIALAKCIYEQGGYVILVDSTYSDVRYLHEILNINAVIGYTQYTPKCSRSIDKLVYYGISKGFNKSIDQYYDRANFQKDLLRKILNGLDLDNLIDWITGKIAWYKLNPPEPVQGANDDLTKLASAQNITFKFQNDKRVFYYDPNRWDEKQNNYNLNFTIYSCHSLVDKCDYYYIEQEGVYSFSNQFTGEYKYDYESALSKIQECYCSELYTNCYLEVDPKYVDILRPAPPTSENNSSITSGITWNLGGAVAFKDGDVTATAQAGVSISNSRTISVNAVNVYNKSADNGSNAQWEYTFLKTDSKFAFFSYGQVDLVDCSNTARSTFTPLNQWIWKVAPEGRVAGETVNCNCTVGLTLMASRGRLVYPAYTEMDNRTTSIGAVFQFEIKQPPIPIIA